MPHQNNNGFLIVASLSKIYYTSAINLARSILDFYPEAKITLCTSKELFDESDRRYFHFVDLTAPYHTRAKLYALSKTTYDITAYIDADCEVRDGEIINIFDQLGNDTDIMLTKIRKYSAANIIISNTETMVWHCGVFLYKNSPLIIEFMEDWWKEYVIQKDCEEWLWPQHSTKMRPWDQYTFYRLYTSDKYSSLKLDVFPGEDARWNFVNNYNKKETTKDPIIFHYTLNKDKIYAENIYKK